MDELIFERIFIPSIEQSNLLNALEEKGVTQDFIAGMYADCIRAESVTRGLLPPPDWKAINAKITARWPKGLTRVKTKAWRELSKHAR